MSKSAEFESMMALDAPINSKMTRWERKTATATSSDRFITNRSGMENEAFDTNNMSVETISKHAKLLLAENDGQNSRVLSFKNKAPLPSEEHVNSLKQVLYSSNPGKREMVKSNRHISATSFKVLDAPELVDDYCKFIYQYMFYFQNIISHICTDLNLMSWSSANVLGVALAQSVYLWDAASGEIKELMNVRDESTDYVSSVSFIPEGGSHIAIGTSSNTVQLWDVQACKQVRVMEGHSSRVGALAWNHHILTSGSRDNTVINHDVRVQNHIVGRMTMHTQEVCGLAWSPDGSYLASGANDNTLMITDAANMHNLNSSARHVLTDHQAAVKALAWSPHERNLLASGGGTADRCIKFWNAGSGALINSVDTGSQVCALQWSPCEKELLSSHGFAENQLCLWKYPTMARIKEFKGHTARVLHMATSPDGSMVCSGAADQTLRFWNIFGSEGGKKRTDNFAPATGLTGTTNSMRIR